MIYIFLTALTLWISQTSAQTSSNLGKNVEATGEKLICDQKDGCKESTFNCVDGLDCVVTCTKEASCEQLIVNGNAATSLKVTCVSSGGACKEIVVDAADVTGDVRVICDGKDACAGEDTILTFGEGEGRLECLASAESCKGIIVYESAEFSCTTTTNCLEIAERIPFAPRAVSEPTRLSNLGKMVSGKGEKLICDQKDGCKQSKFSCVEGKDCKVECTKEAACEQLIIDGNAASSLKVTCQSGGDACKEIVVQGFTVTGDVKVTCDGKDACAGEDTILTFGQGEGKLECLTSAESCKGIIVNESKDFKCVTEANCLQIGERIAYGAAHLGMEFSDHKNNNNNVIETEYVVGLSKNTMINIWVFFIGMLLVNGLIAYCFCLKGKKRTKVTFDHETSISSNV